MSDLIKELDAAVTGERTASKLREKHPEASEQTIENALRITELARRLKGLATDVLQKPEQKQQRQDSETDLERSYRSAREQVAALAAQTGSATEEDKHLLKQRAEARTDNQSDLGKIFDPDTEY
ncbi:hypothetical protein [Haloarcula onubensis]|uniref:Uncharacterized protein n=1 Tax=Haloarcula onubensis TaxID=2950539 RepID=A0ABU2FWB1_9EURY|nr:hypothetical protein [Halomicroarcula sp. S3CR25-11]MDS0284734.1 hypothetical protein [Halomicroarcula sp. S3CR25-11]